MAFGVAQQGMRLFVGRGEGDNDLFQSGNSFPPPVEGKKKFLWEKRDLSEEESVRCGTQSGAGSGNGTLTG